MKYLLLFLNVSTCLADNTDSFNKAYQWGKQNQFNLNLNQDSTINSYGRVNSFESTVANNANSGNAKAQNMYNNTYGNKANPNYLYNEGVQEIAACQDKSDPRCTTLNKYGDKDTQTQLQAYNHGISEKYYISVKPDPAASSCATITRKVPINKTIVSCIASAHTQTNCNASIGIWLSTYECDPNNGSCNVYQNSDCKLVRPYVPAVCKTWSYTFWYGCKTTGSLTCAAGSTFSTPGWCGGGSETRLCNGTDYGEGRGGHPTCVLYTQAQLAAYRCKSFNYGDGCAGFKQ
jgi:hypothetical protein